MKLKVGMYVRSKVNGLIDKIANIEELVNEKDVLYYELGHKNSGYGFCSTEIDSVKASDKLIDLIEVGDYVNGRYVYETGYNLYDYFGVKIEEDLKHSEVIEECDIKSIVTKECFEQISYKVGD